MEKRFCPECGHQVSVNAKFCERCGQRLSTRRQSSSEPPGMEVNRANRWAQAFLKLGLPPLDSSTRTTVNQTLGGEHPRLGENEVVICTFPIKTSSSSLVVSFLKEFTVPRHDISISVVKADDSTGKQLFFFNDGLFIVTSKRLVTSTSDGSRVRIIPLTNLLAATVEESSEQILWLALHLKNKVVLRSLVNLPRASLGAATVALFHDDSVVRESRSRDLQRAEGMANDARSAILTFFNELPVGAA